MRTLLVAVAIAVCVPGETIAQDLPRPDFDPSVYNRSNLPDSVSNSLWRQGYWETLGIYSYLNPFYVTGDFDGDGLPDVAIQVYETGSRKRGVLIWHRGDQSVHLLGAGRDFEAGGDDWRWLWVWRTTGDRWVPEAVGDALYVSKPEAASAWIWWDGIEYRWTQGGD